MKDITKRGMKMNLIIPRIIETDGAFNVSALVRLPDRMVFMSSWEEQPL